MRARGDTGLRDLERRWRASGDPADEARLLAERLRLGELTRERLELAAFVGHIGARTALGDGAPAGRVPLRRWVAALDEAGRVAVIRTGLDDVMHGLAARAAPVDPSTRRAMAALRAWCACPCDEHHASLDDTRPAPAGLRSVADGREAARDLLAVAMRHLIDAALVPDDLTREDALELVLGGVLRYADDAPVPPSALVAWCLGPDHAGSSRTRAEAPDAPRRYLADRVRRGEVTTDGLELAAAAGDPTAREVLGTSSPTPDDRAWVAGLARSGPELPLRALAELAGTSLATPLLRWYARGYREHDASGPGSDWIMSALRALSRWAASPDAARRADVVRLTGIVLDAFGGPRAAPVLRALDEALRAVRDERRDVTDVRARVLAATDDADQALASLREAVARWALE